tara:strand:+ start:692 stop:1387 length:696 start_codon:yes stop_codon:yes gene_type:complete
LLGYGYYLIFASSGDKEASSSEGVFFFIFARFFVNNKIINYMNEEYEVERQIESLVNMDLSLEDMPSHENNAKALVVGAGMLVPYILGQVANFLFEETIASIRAQIYERGLKFGMQMLAFELFKYFFADKTRLVFVQKTTPTFLKFFLKYATIVPDIDMNDVHAPDIVMELIKDMIMNSDTPFKVDVNSIISFYRINTVASNNQDQLPMISENVIRKHIRQSIKNYVRGKI